jgi:hypothetical protein
LYLIFFFFDLDKETDNINPSASDNVLNFVIFFFFNSGFTTTSSKPFLLGILVASIKKSVLISIF